VELYFTYFTPLIFVERSYTYNYNLAFRILKFWVLNLLLGLYRQRNKLAIRFSLQRWYVQYMAGMVWEVGEI